MFFCKSFRSQPMGTSKSIPCLGVSWRGWKWMVGSYLFPFGFHPLFRCYAFSFREGEHIYIYFQNVSIYIYVHVRRYICLYFCWICWAIFFNFRFIKLMHHRKIKVVQMFQTQDPLRSNEYSCFFHEKTQLPTHLWTRHGTDWSAPPDLWTKIVEMIGALGGKYGNKT